MKTILKSLAAIVAVGAVAGGATFAYFSDTAIVSNSTITAGTLDLKVDSNLLGGSQSWSDGFASPIRLTNLAPGYDQSQIVDIKKFGSVNGDASIRLVLTSNKNSGSANTWDGQLAQNMRVRISYSPANNGTFGSVLYDNTLAEFNANPNQLALGALTGTTDSVNQTVTDGKIASVKLEWYIPTSVGNDIQGDSVTVDTIFGLEQTR